MLSKRRTNSGFYLEVGRISKAKKITKIINEERNKKITNSKILDIGTGNGEIASFIGKQNDLFSIDINDNRKSKENYTFIQSLEELPFKDEAFDIVISNHVVEHVYSAELHFKEIKRVLKPGGLLYLATPNRAWPYEVHYKLFLLHYLPVKVFDYILKKAGLYTETVKLYYLNEIEEMIGNKNINYYSTKIIKSPNKYFYKTNSIVIYLSRIMPEKFISKLKSLHPTTIITYKKII